MTREEAKKLLPVIQAFSEGKEIQCRNTRPPGNWMSILYGATFGAPNCEWRIKPEPREFWLIKWKDGGISAYNNLQYDTSRPISHTNFDEQIHVKEVLD